MSSPRIDRLLVSAREVIAPRVTASELPSALAAGALLVDIRPIELRRRDGDFSGAVVVDRNVLEWRLDPTSPHRLAEMDPPGRRVIIACDEGYASSLAAATLCQLGVDATDLDGGFQAWRAQRRPG